MYNEEVEELKQTLEGVMYNYSYLCRDPSLDFQEQDILVVLVCDGFDKVSKTFKELSTQKKFYDENQMKK